ncbi:MAG TPA: hypothetical protein VKB93_24820 [Thermoanaerobaculia bacterium]|nr:hypothetical protein [Thermoanaerobaculia bacterium]
MTEPVALIEPHDGVIERITMCSTTLTLTFSHLAVYVPKAKDEYDIWIYRSTLTLTNLTRLVIEGVDDSMSGLDDAVFVGDDTERIEWTSLLSACRVKQFEVTYTSGARLYAACSEARLVLDEPVRFLEKWLGPL